MRSKNALIFHGTGGTADGNWFPWLKKELESHGYRVAVPLFPTPEGQSFISWWDILEDYADMINEQSVLIGHSLGGLFLLRVLERLQQPVDTACFVAAPIGVRPIKFYESDEAFSGFNFDWSKIKVAAKHFAVFHSDNDPYVSLGNGEKLAKELEVPLTFIPNAGHLNAESGYTSFAILLETILSPEREES